MTDDEWMQACAAVNTAMALHAFNQVPAAIARAVDLLEAAEFHVQMSKRPSIECLTDMLGHLINARRRSAEAWEDLAPLAGRLVALRVPINASKAE